MGTILGGTALRYAVKILHDNDLPEGLDWCIVREPEHLTACVKRSRATDPYILAEAWSGVRHAQDSFSFA